MLRRHFPSEVGFLSVRGAADRSGGCSQSRPVPGPCVYRFCFQRFPWERDHLVGGDQGAAQSPAVLGVPPPTRSSRNPHVASRVGTRSGEIGKGPCRLARCVPHPCRTQTRTELAVGGPAGLAATQGPGGCWAHGPPRPHHKRGSVLGLCVSKLQHLREPRSSGRLRPLPHPAWPAASWGGPQEQAARRPSRGAVSERKVPCFAFAASKVVFRWISG